MITIDGRILSGRNRWDREVLQSYLPYETRNYRPISLAAARIERALDAGVDITAAIEALDALEGDCDLEDIDERKPEEAE